MSTRTLLLASTFALVSLFASRASAADAWVVGPGFFPNIQQAVDAAADGDVVLVKPGGASFTFLLDGKGLSVIADASRPLALFALRMRNVPAGSTVVIAGFSIVGCNSGASLLCSDSVGAIRIQECTLGSSDCLRVAISNCSDVSLSECSITGTTNPLTGAMRGLFATNSSVTLHATSLFGGNGLRASVAGIPVVFPPAAAVRAEGGELFIGGGTIRGGRGLPGSDGTCGGSLPPSAGGPGATGFENAGAVVHHLDATIEGGPGGEGGWGGGTCYAPDGPAGPAVSGTGPMIALIGEHRVLESTPPVRESGVQTLAVRGQPGDRAFVALSGRTDRHHERSLNGVVPFRQPARRLFLGTLDGTGTLTVALPVPELGAGVDARRWFAQVIVLGVNDQLWLGSPSCPTFLDSSF